MKWTLRRCEGSLADRLPQALVGVADDEVHPVQAALDQSPRKVRVGCVVRSRQ
jgi:hypothetical protein